MVLRSPPLRAPRRIPPLQRLQPHVSLPQDPPTPPSLPPLDAADLRRLISHLLDPDPATRISVDGIVRDPWFPSGLDPDELWLLDAPTVARSTVALAAVSSTPSTSSYPSHPGSTFPAYSRMRLRNRSGSRLASRRTASMTGTWRWGRQITILA
ncbi:hypothetical protein BHE74_00053943 [Ensete ventricosum]|nr:hypothetical protein BHE74_00053943 [Ensete ventricosum]